MARPVVTDRLVAGVDVGGTKIAVLVVDRSSTLLASTVTATEVGVPERAVDQVVGAIDAALASAGAGRADLAAAGVGVPGRVAAEGGHVVFAVNLGWRDVPLGPGLAARLGVPVAVENDVRAGAVGVHCRPEFNGVADLAYVAVGTGIAAGVILGGRLHRGTGGLAGEIGHVVVDPDGPPCPCGLRGCLEAVASGPAIARRAEIVLATGRASLLNGCRPLTAAAVFGAAATGDELALDVVEESGTWIARAVHLLVMTYGVRRVVIGGGVAAAGPTFLDPILRALDRMRAASDVARNVLPADVVALLPAESEIAAWGAVTLARARIADPAARGAREVGDA